MSIKSYNDFVTRMQDMAERHMVLRHGKPTSDGSPVTRVSFFEANNEETVRQSIGAGNITYPILVMLGPNAKYEYDGEISRNSLYGFEIRTHVPTNADKAAIRAAHSECEEIAEQLLARIMRYSEDEHVNGPFYAFSPERVQGEFIGPIYDGEYGYAVMWANKSGAWDPFQFEPASCFDDEDGEVPVEPEEGSEWEQIGW